MKTKNSRCAMIFPNFKSLIITFLIMLNLKSNAAINQEYCLQLQKLMSDNKLQYQLLEWVDKEFDESIINIRDTATFNSDIKPGKFTYKGQEFNWGLLNFNKKKSSIKLLGLEIDNFFEDYNAPSNLNKPIKELQKPANSTDIDSIFFAEKSYYGILIKLKTSDKFIDEKYQKDLHIITDRIAVLCSVPNAPRDNY